jgi:hypothetical protein
MLIVFATNHDKFGFLLKLLAKTTELFLSLDSKQKSIKPLCSEPKSFGVLSYKIQKQTEQL